MKEDLKVAVDNVQVPFELVWQLAVAKITAGAAPDLARAWRSAALELANLLADGLSVSDSEEHIAAPPPDRPWNHALRFRREISMVGTLEEGLVLLVTEFPVE